MILEEAIKIIKERQKLYGSPSQNFECIADLLSALGFRRINLSDGVDFVHPKDIATIMIAVKLAREYHTSNKDNLVDIAGYVACDANVKGHE